ncbi:TIGR00266 family protein [Leptothoe sp. PORK10 BA2]|uniref:TIGR00266 family protein n=1 Tax=Leptothoe sp. PORK10 BA2 TaxID=3110254 RepID=UPI002B1F4D22|nr:TIGR00266 family protein [Leptothoe sp. PORK10 BA2]MEA5466710.1 TIGR00266 family protein [Leptothoe sp. PORK10 BA2]
MNIELLHQPDSAIAKILMDPQEEMIAEAGAMVAMSGHVNVSTTLRKGKGGGVLGGLKRVLGGESLFMSVFRSGSSAAELYLAPKLIGDILAYTISGTDLVVQSSGYMASTPGVDIDLGFTGFKSLFSGESLFWLTASGSGLILLSAFGGIYEVDVDGGYVVDTGHIVAFERSLDYSIAKANNSWAGAFFGGEGFVCKFRGRGKVFCQTHNPGSFGRLIGSKLPPR